MLSRTIKIVVLGGVTTILWFSLLNHQVLMPRHQKRQRSLIISDYLEQMGPNHFAVPATTNSLHPICLEPGAPYQWLEVIQSNGTVVHYDIQHESGVAKFRFALKRGRQ